LTLTWGGAIPIFDHEGDSGSCLGGWIMNRRDFIKSSAVLTGAVIMAPLGCAQAHVSIDGENDDRKDYDGNRCH
jgi:hypothetical protein